jgi:hypothetical protein
VMSRSFFTSAAEISMSSPTVSSGYPPPLA